MSRQDKSFSERVSTSLGFLLGENTAASTSSIVTAMTNSLPEVCQNKSARIIGRNQLTANRERERERQKEREGGREREERERRRRERERERKRKKERDREGERERKREREKIGRAHD